MDRVEVVHKSLMARIKAGTFPAQTGTLTLAEAGLSPAELIEIFHCQVLSRQLDRVARELQARREAYYTIGSSGHEGNAAIAAAFRPTDMAFLHYRDGAFQIARARQVPGETPLWDMLLSFTSSMEDPISGGRHKVLGSKTLAIPPQTSTIASHLPKAVGAAYSIGLAKQIRPHHQHMPDDGVVLCSFGDASLNHSTAQGALNAASWTAYQNVPLPLVFICEDNGIGISVETPAGWIEATMKSRPGLEYFRCNGLDVVETYAVARRVADWARAKRRPAFLHMSCVRLYGHAGADVETAYRSMHEIEADEANDPLLYTARHLVANGVLSADEVLALCEEAGVETARAAEEAIKRPRLQTAKQVMASLVPPKRSCGPKEDVSPEKRAETFGASDMRAMQTPQHMAKLINFALTDLMLEHREVVVAGEDVGRKGGVYGVTQRLQQRFTARRVIDTLLDEQSILGLAIGLAHNGFVPIPEIQFLAYLHNAEDQLRGEAATLPFFSNGQFTNPMVVRIAGLGYQRGFGGHFHNDNSIAVLRDIPGLVIACPSNGTDAVLMLRECVRLAREEQRVVVFLEPIALYMTRDLHERGDGLWAHVYPPPDAALSIGLGEIGISGEGTDLAIVTYGNGTYFSRQAAKALRDQHGVSARIVDVRWLAPLPIEAILAAARPCERVLFVDECRRTGSQSEALMALFAENSDQPIARIAAEDSFIATGPAFGATLPSRDAIIEAALDLVSTSASQGRELRHRA
jgi:2-oxoisovalerate dehydrogenase E1 component